jgi:hypothetical protein
VRALVHKSNCIQHAAGKYIFIIFEHDYSR